jgi:hypothetical protein
MNGAQIKYCKGYKYQLVEDYSVVVPITGYDIALEWTDYISLTKDGLLTIKDGYAWDGCSGPTWDDKTNMRAGLVHDALYQLMRLGLLPLECRPIADKLFYDMCLEDGMWKFRAKYYHEGVEHFGYASAKLGANPYPILTAP